MAGSSAFLTPRGAGPSRMRSAGPCPHYQRTGVCLLGNLCLYDHSQESRREGLFTQNEDYVALDDPTVELEAMLAMRTGELESMRAKLREMYRAQGVATSERGGIAGESQFQSEGLAAFPPREQEIIRRHVGGADADRQRKGKKRKRGGRTLTHAKRERNRLREDRDRGEVAGRDRHDESRSASPAASEQHTLLRNAIPSSSVLRLDNRPKRMIIAPIEPGSDKDEVLRRYLQYFDGVKEVNPHPDPEYPSTLIVTFVERYHGDIFQKQVPEVLHMSPEELVSFWIPDDVAVPMASIEMQVAYDGGHESETTIKEEEVEVKMEDSDGV